MQHPQRSPTSLPHGAMVDVVDLGSPSLRWEPSAPDDAGGSWRLEDDVGGRKVLTVRPAPQRDFWSSWDRWDRWRWEDHWNGMSEDHAWKISGKNITRWKKKMKKT